jgi:hypothetical protein
MNENVTLNGIVWEMMWGMKGEMMEVKVVVEVEVE